MESNGNGAHPDEIRLPDWICMLIGRLQLENEALRQALAGLQQQQMAAAMPPDGDPPDVKQFIDQRVEQAR